MDAIQWRGLVTSPMSIIILHSLHITLLINKPTEMYNFKDRKYVLKVLNSGLV